MQGKASALLFLLGFFVGADLQFDKLTAPSKAEGRVCPYDCHFMWKPEGFRYIWDLTVALSYEERELMTEIFS